MIELPVETFLISGREGTGTLTAILLLERREIDETVAIKGGRPTEPYPIYMAVAHHVGYDRRGNTIYRRERDGSDIIEHIPIADPATGKTIRTTKERVVANDLPSIAKDYIAFRDHVRRGQVHFDKSEGIYRVIG